MSRDSTIPHQTNKWHETVAEIAEVVPLATVDVDVQVVSSHRSISGDAVFLNNQVLLPLSIEIAYQFRWWSHPLSPYLVVRKCSDPRAFQVYR